MKAICVVNFTILCRVCAERAPQCRKKVRALMRTSSRSAGGRSCPQKASPKSISTNRRRRHRRVCAKQRSETSSQLCRAASKERPFSATALPIDDHYIHCLQAQPTSAKPSQHTLARDISLQLSKATELSDITVDVHLCLDGNIHTTNLLCPRPRRLLAIVQL